MGSWEPVGWRVAWPGPVLGDESSRSSGLVLYFHTETSGADVHKYPLNFPPTHPLQGYSAAGHRDPRAGPVLTMMGFLSLTQEGKPPLPLPTPAHTGSHMGGLGHPPLDIIQGMAIWLKEDPSAEPLGKLK